MREATNRLVVLRFRNFLSIQIDNDGNKIIADVKVDWMRECRRSIIVNEKRRTSETIGDDNGRLKLEVAT